ELDERKQQSAILRSLGAEPSTIRGILILHSMIVAFGGLIVAMVLALLITNALPFIGISSLADAKSIIATACVLFFGVLAGRMTTLRSAEELNQPSLFYQHHWRIYLGVSTKVSAITMVYAFSEARTMLRSTLLAWIAFPALVIVVVTLSPLIVRGICKIIQTPVAWITKTHPFVLDDHARANERRMNGSVLAISVGLSAFIWMICWAASLLDSFMIDPRMPRWMVSVYPYGVDQVETEKVLATPKYKKMEPLVLVDTRMAHRSPDLTLARLESGSKSRRGRVPEPNIGDRESSVKYKEVSDRTSLTPTLVFGVRPAYARDELPIQFLQGDANSAFTTLTDEDACLIDSWYAESHDVNVGDAISIAVPGKSLSDSSAVAVYTVHGVVEMKGWLMATKQNKTRLSSRPHEALVMLNIDRVRQDFGTAHANYFIGDPTIDESGKLSDYPSNVSLRAGIEASMKDRIAMSNAIRKTIDLNRSLPHSVDNGRVITINERSVQTDDLDRVRDALNGSWGAATVKRLSWLPLIFLAFSLMSVTGSLVAAMQSRSRELGILRSLGMSRLGIARLTLAESLLQGFSAIVLSSIIGLGGAWIMLQVARIAGFNLRWQGINADLRIHWSWLWPGWLVTLIICIFASIVAAWRFSRMSPAKLFTTGTTDKA
ncbi:MAG: FtsX-like permease family protein, partial [Planctomycetota bacterium]